MASKTRKQTGCNFSNIKLKDFKRKTRLAKYFNVYDLKYSSPVRKDIAVGFVFFNSAKSKRLLMNYLYVVEKLKLAGIPYYTIEMFENEPEIADAFHVKTEFILFQKERLCYLLEKQIPKTFNKLMFMDCDLLFDNLNWYNELSLKLDNFEIVQPFSRGVWLDITYKQAIKDRIPMVFYSKFGSINATGGVGGYHPGFAWAFQRDWFNKVGFFQYAILGDGDTYSSTVWLDYKGFNYRDFIYDAIQDYKKSVSVRPKMCFLNGNIYHLWHGDSINRQYSERRRIFKNIKDIRDIIQIADNGLFKLKDRSLEAKIRKYFKNRDDDGVAVIANIPTTHQ